MALVTREVPSGAVFIIADEYVSRGGSGPAAGGAAAAEATPPSKPPATTYYRTIHGDWASDEGRPGEIFEIVVAPPPPLPIFPPPVSPSGYHQSHAVSAAAAASSAAVTAAMMMMNNGGQGGGVGVGHLDSPGLVRPPAPAGGAELSSLLAEVKKLREEIAAM
jgi:hypothetical protein